MGWCQLRKKILKTCYNKDKKEYNTQRKQCLEKPKKEKKNYNNLDHDNVTDNKTFQKFIKPLFSGKSSTHNKIALVEEDVILDKYGNVTEVLNICFTNVVSNLNIPKHHGKSINVDHMEDPIAISIEQYKNHPSVVAK